MPAPHGTDSQLGWAFEKADNVFVGDETKFIRAPKFSGYVAKRGYEKTQNMDSSGQELKGYPLGATLMPKIEFDPDVNTISPLLAHLSGKAPTISNPTAGVYQWLLTPKEYGDSAPATWQDSIFFVAHDGDGNPVLVSGARATEWAVKIAERKILSNSFSFIGCFDSYQSKATVVSPAATYTGHPILRGHRAASAAGTLKVKATAAAGGGFDGTVKFTLAAYAGSTTIQILFDTWYRVALDTGVRAGVSRFEDLWFYFPSSGGTLLAANDEWSFSETRAVATASYSALDPLNAGGALFTVDGVEKYSHNIDLKVTRPLKGSPTVGSKYFRTAQKNGPFAVSVSIDRDREDRDFLVKLIRGTSIAVVVDLYGNQIGSTIYDERIKVNIPAMQVTDDQRDVATPNALPEKIELVGFRSGTGDIYDMTATNTLSSLVIP